MAPSKDRDRIQIDVTPRDRAALQAIYTEIPGVIEAGEAAVARTMMRLGMALFARNPSLRFAEPPEAADLTRMMREAASREPDTPPTGSAGTGGLTGQVHEVLGATRAEREARRNKSKP